GWPLRRSGRSALVGERGGGQTWAVSSLRLQARRHLRLCRPQRARAPIFGGWHRRLDSRSATALTLPEISYTHYRHGPTSEGPRGGAADRVSTGLVADAATASRSSRGYGPVGAAVSPRGELPQTAEGVAMSDAVDQYVKAVEPEHAGESLA